ncbi:MAG: HlyD family efflux transporter periplasmic adaptor subunit [Gammaproteobacteria bacterium]
MNTLQRLFDESADLQFIEQSSPRPSRQLVHEAEVQRQHVRFTLPVKAIIGSAVYRVADWSVGGAGISEITPSGAATQLFEKLNAGDSLPLELVFEFEDFRFTLPLTGEVRYFNREAGRLGLRFLNVSPRTLSFMHFVIDAHLSGEVVYASDIIEIAARNPLMAPRGIPAAAKPRDIAGRIAHVGQRVATYGLVGLITLALIGLVCSSLYEKLYIIQAPAAQVAADVTVAAAPTAGQIGFMLDEHEQSVQQGKPLFGIRDGSQSGLTLEAPCDCKIIARVARAGEFVDKGQAVFVLAQPAAKPFVIAHVAPEDALALQQGVQVRVSFSDGMVSESASIREIRRPASQWKTSNQGFDPKIPVEVVIDPGRELPLAAIGSPTKVSFDTFATRFPGQLLQDAASSWLAKNH